MLLADVGLPGINGRQLADEASRRHADIKILFLTGYAKDAIIHDGVLDEGIDLLTKPFTMNNLARKVAQVLQQAPT